VLRIGIDNYVSAAVATASIEPIGHTASMVQDTTVTNWTGYGACTLTLTWAVAKAVQLLTLHRVTLMTSVTVSGTLAAVPVFSHAFTYADLDGIDVLSLYTGLSGTVDKIVFTFAGAGNPSVGYVWAGACSDVKAEKIQLTDNALDIVNVTTGSFAASSSRPVYRSIQATIEKRLFSDTSTLTRAILRSGYGVPRPVVLLADACFVDDSMLAILDSGKVQYDIFDTRPERKTQATIGFTEIFGSV
jgi:hypothetical protein